MNSRVCLCPRKRTPKFLIEFRAFRKPLGQVFLRKISSSSYLSKTKKVFLAFLLKINEEKLWLVKRFFQGFPILCFVRFFFLCLNRLKISISRLFVSSMFQKT